MQKFIVMLVVALIALAPAFAAAQTSPGSGTKPPASGSSPSGSSGSSTAPSTSGGSTSGSSSSPSASPSGTEDLSKITNKADCDKAQGEWKAADSKCEKKKM